MKAEEQIAMAYDALLANWPVPYQEEIVQTRYGETFVLAFGKLGAPALVLLHGASSNSSFWLGQARQFARDFMVYAVDIPGEPGKSNPNHLSYKTLEHANWLSDVLEALNIRNVTLLGLSQGGWVALRFATCYPESVEALILLTPAGIVPTKKSFIFRALLYSLFGEPGLKKINRIVLGKQIVQIQILGYMDLILTNCRPRTDQEYLFKDKELEKLDMPVLLIGGEDDVVRDCEAISKRLTSHLENLESRIIPNAGHVILDVYREILSFSKRKIWLI